MSNELLRKLEKRLGPLHARQQLGIEKDHEAQVFGQGLIFFHLENWYSAPAIIRSILKLTGLYWRARRNAERIVVRRNDLRFAELPLAFDGFTILHISDLHADMNEVAMGNLIQLVRDMQYDLCVLTGDYRGKTFGPFEPALEGVAKVPAQLKEPIFGVLGNHDTIQMVPTMEAMGIRILLNESEAIARGDQRIYLAGIDDAHFYRADNIEKAALQIPESAFSILLSHTPEVYRQAAHANLGSLRLRALQVANSGRCRRANCWRQRSGKDEAGSIGADRIDKVRASGNVTAQAAEYLRERALNHVDALHHALSRRDPGSGRAVHADRMDFV